MGPIRPFLYLCAGIRTHDLLVLSPLTSSPIDFQEISLESTVSDFLTAQCQLSMDGPRLRPLSIRTDGQEARRTNGADGSDDSDDLVKKINQKTSEVVVVGLELDNCTTFNLRPEFVYNISLWPIQY